MRGMSLLTLALLFLAGLSQVTAQPQLKALPTVISGMEPITVYWNGVQGFKYLFS